MEGQKKAQDWINIIEGDSSGFRDTDIYPRLKEWVNRISPESILEVGSGQGICSDKIELSGRSYTGLEVSPLLVARAKTLYHASNRNFVLGNAYNMPFSDNVYDAVFSVSVLHLIEDLKKFMDEMARVLKDQGSFYIMTANPKAYSLWTDSYTDKSLEGTRFEGKMQMEGLTVSEDTLYLHPYNDIINSFEDVSL
ncbi:MAG TPA: class I SAM-dependent methyltransferase [Bacteriovoracaceae bacterium]|nr:class I SAM-dependent methyltransferase [Bacteriovoracaceae bacterium]